MSPTLKFKYRRFPINPSEAFPGRVDVLRPAIPVQLLNGDKKLGCLAIIDSGADFSIFHASLGELIGLTIESGKTERFSGVSEDADELTAYFHAIRIVVEGYEFDCWTGFSRDVEDSPYGLLGQLGFFSLFSVHLDYGKETIELHTV